LPLLLLFGSKENPSPIPYYTYSIVNLDGSSNV